MDFLENWKNKKKKKVVIGLIITTSIFLFFIIIIVVLVEIISGGVNNTQSVGENATSSINPGEIGENALISLLCQNCDIEQTNEKSGIKGSEFLKKMSEMINLYNTLELGNERDDEFDFALISATINYGKKMQAEIFSDSSKFSAWKFEENLTNKDINHFPNVTDISADNAQQFYKWAAVMLGTPYALPDINLRGLLGNLVTGKVVTTCVPGNDNKSTLEQQEELIKDIIKVEKKLSGEEVSDPSIWDKILSIFGKKYDSDTEVLSKRLKNMFKMLGKPNSEYADLEPYINLDNYNPELQCPSGQMRKHTYTKFMNYDQYKVYLEKVFIPQNYINCDECISKNISDKWKQIETKDILEKIFMDAAYSREYLQMSEIDYDNIMYGTIISNKDLAYFSSPIKSACTVTSPYSELRGAYPHLAVDTTITDGNYALYAIADGVVESINVYTTENIGNTYDENLGTCTAYNGTKNSGIEMYIKHEINGKTYRTRYVHLDPDLDLKVGDTVKKGQKVAKMGNTGCSTGTHLHFELSDGESNINPTNLFSNCAGSEISGRLVIRTTDNFVNSNKCMMNDLTLDEVITGLIKKDYEGASMYPDYVRSLAIVIRTKLMKETQWCNTPIKEKVSVDIENNSSDLMIYNYVIDTQGMVLNYSGEMLKNVSYSKFPCNQLPTDWRNPGNTATVLNTLGITDQNPRTPEFINSVNDALSAYNAGCIRYNEKGGIVTVNFETIPKEVTDTYKGKYTASISIPYSSITQTSKNAQGSFSTIAARYLSTTYTYTGILNKFYAAKTKKGDEYIGVVDISTSPGLIDAKTSVLNKAVNKSQGFTYGEILPGTNNIPTGSMSDSELQTINDHLKNYVDNAEINAIAKGDINPKRARVMAAAYWLIYNPFYRVQYQWGKPLEHDNYDGIGWDPAWSSIRGIECQNFVVWSIWNSNPEAKSIYSSWSELQHSTGIHNNGNDFTVKQVLDMGIEPGDVIRRSMTEGANGHWAIIMTTNREECYVEVAHAINVQLDTKISRYYCGEEFRYQHLYKLPLLYNDEAWKASTQK